MAGPLQGLGYQNIPLSTPYQPGGSNTQVRNNQERDTQQAQAQAAPNETQATSQAQVDVTVRAQAPEETSSRVALTDDAPSQRRGSVVDLTV